MGNSSSNSNSGSKKRTSSLLQDNNHRGLESWTTAGSLKLDHTIEQCIMAVMDEQDRQWREDDDDETKIAKCSMVVTQDSANRAYAHGAKDAEEALKLSRESWDKTNTNGSVNSCGTSGSFGTTAIVKKKKRKSLLRKLDDSSTSKLSRS